MGTGSPTPCRICSWGIRYDICQALGLAQGRGSTNGKQDPAWKGDHGEWAVFWTKAVMGETGEGFPGRGCVVSRAWRRAMQGLSVWRQWITLSATLEWPEKQASRMEGKVQAWAEGFEPQTQEFVNLCGQLNRDPLRVWGREYRNC